MTPRTRARRRDLGPPSELRGDGSLEARPRDAATGPRATQGSLSRAESAPACRRSRSRLSGALARRSRAGAGARGTRRDPLRPCALPGCRGRSRLEHGRCQLRHARPDRGRRHRPRAARAPDQRDAIFGVVTGEMLGPVSVRTPDGGELSFFGMFATFDTPFEVTTSELAIELLFPADRATAETLRERGTSVTVWLMLSHARLAHRCQPLPVPHASTSTKSKARLGGASAGRKSSPARRAPSQSQGRRRKRSS